MGPRVEVADVAVPGTSPQAIMIAPARKFSCLSMPNALILEQSNPTGTSGSVEWVIILPFVIPFMMPWAAAEKVAAPELSSARKTPVRTMHRPIKTRGLKKADFEVDFFFMELANDVDGIKV